jgi:hypothetical protein
MGDGIARDWQSQPFIKHRFSYIGNHTIRLRAMNEDGIMSDWTETVLTVTNLPPEARMIFHKQKMDCDDQIKFDLINITDPDGWIWKVEAVIDGKTIPIPFSSTWARYVTVFSTPGTRTVSFLITDNNGGVTEMGPITIEIVNRRPTARFRFVDQYFSTDKAIVLDAGGSVDRDGGRLHYIWDLGNGDTLYGKRVEYTFRKEGVYGIRLTVMDESGAFDTTDKVITVQRHVEDDAIMPMTIQQDQIGLLHMVLLIIIALATVYLVARWKHSRDIREMARLIDAMNNSEDRWKRQDGHSINLRLDPWAAHGPYST